MSEIFTSVWATPHAQHGGMACLHANAPTGNGSLLVNTNTQSRLVSCALKRCASLVLEGSTLQGIT
eukprot:1192559-Rhodomonas_salina.2